MKRCRSDELRQPEEDPGAAGEPPGPAAMEAKPGEAAAAAAPEAGTVPPPRTKPPDLKVSGGGSGRRVPVGWQRGEHPGGVTGGVNSDVTSRTSTLWHYRWGYQCGEHPAGLPVGCTPWWGTTIPTPCPCSATGVTLEDAAWPQDGHARG